jgi:short-subunit dehydrogenase
MGTHGDFASQDPDALVDEIQLNVASLVDLTRALLPQMLERRSGLKMLAVSPGPMRTEFFDKLGTSRPGAGHRRASSPEH